jgi:hypothetical protein
MLAQTMLAQTMLAQTMLAQLNGLCRTRRQPECPTRTDRLSKDVPDNCSRE